jgi:hypothetical protein
LRRLDGDIKLPAKSTIHAVPDRHDLVQRSDGPRHRARHAAIERGLPLRQWRALRESNALFNLSKLVAQARQAETGFHLTEWLTSLDFAHRAVRARLLANEK